MTVIPWPGWRRRRPLPPRSDAHAWAARIREQMGWAGCGDPAHLADTPFRRRVLKKRPVDECVLRDLARRQLAEMRTAAK